MLRQSLSQTQIQTLRQELIPAQILSLEILQAAIPELEQKLHELAEKNPTLEVIEPGTEQLSGNPLDGAVGAGPAPPPESEFEGGAESGAEDGAGETAEQGLRVMAGSGSHGDTFDWEPGGAGAGDEGFLNELAESWREYMPEESTGHSQRSEEAEERRQFRFDSLTAPVTLQDSLMEQLGQQDALSETLRRIGEEIVGSIDETGYLRTHPADIAIACGVDLDEVNRALAVVRAFDPPGVGAMDLRECLLLQLERQGRRDSLVWKVVDQHLDDLARNQIPQLAKTLGVSPNRVYEILAEIRQLQPHPAAPGAVSSSPGIADAQTFIVPEIRVYRNDKGEWAVESNREARPRLRLSRHYLRMIQNPETDSETRAFLRQKLGESKLLIKALSLRQSTLERITWSLLRHQRDFFEHGLGSLHPLTLSQVARELDLHETTIGRATSAKYVDTPHGIVAYKQFFSSGGVENAGGEKISNISVKQKIHELIQGEDSAKPLPDDQIVRLLAEAGLPVARRTVAKYREEMNIPASHLRRNFR